MYGGINAGQPPKGPIAMLDTISLVWSVPQFTNPVLSVIPNVFQHTATLVDKYMFVAFGKLLLLSLKFNTFLLTNLF